MKAQPVRCAVVLPAPVPYREPLFAALAASERIRLRVIYQSANAPSWDQPREWFPSEHSYDAGHLRARLFGRPGRTPIVWPRGLGRALSAFDPEVVVSSEFGLPTLRALAWCGRRGRPLVILTEVTADVAALLPAPKRLVHRWLATHARGFIAVSSRARRRLLDLGVAPDAVELSLQSANLDPVRVAAAVRQPRPPGAPVRFIAVGRLVPDKNYARLIQAFASDGLRPEDAELHVHGVGPLEHELRALAERAGAAAVFHRHSPAAVLASAYADADVCVIVSTYEPFGVVVREAVAAGLPLVCSRRVGAVDDLALEGRNALLVDPEDATSIAAALARVCRDADLRLSLAAGSRAVDDDHPLERDAAAFERAILRAAGRA
jgi:glycosyltransferase involved in cell wall biosynthesis